MMYKVEDEADNNNEDVEENFAFGNEAEWTAIIVQHQVTIAKAKERALLLFKQTKPDKDGVMHSYTTTIPKIKTKLFLLAIHYVSCGIFSYGSKHHKLHVWSHVRSFSTFLHSSSHEQFRRGSMLLICSVFSTFHNI
jgi:hypothetical protein